MHQDQKKVWTNPEMRRFGSFEEATQSCTNKDFGSADGITLGQSQVPIGCGS